jgi:hypothetical protein
MKRAIVSYATLGREDYPRAMKRMAAYARKTNPIVDLHLVSPDIAETHVEGVEVYKGNPPGMPAHKDIPYGFKPWLFNLAFQAGYQQVLWCDSTIVIHRDLAPIWNIASAVGACLFDNPGCPMRVWTSDDCMDAIGCPYHEPHQAMFNETMACAMAFDFSNPIGAAIFSEWFAICNDGVSFAGRGGSRRPEFREHRHDQSVISWLAQKYSIPLISYGTLVYNADRPKFQNSYILANTGVIEKIL